MTDLLLAGAGLVILLIAGDLLVRGAVALSLRLGIPAIIVSLTIVAFGTSAPELLIAIKAALNGYPGLALGNVIGSNTANVLLVLGVPALVTGLAIGECDTRQSYVQMVAVSMIFIALCFLGPLHFLHGTILLVLLTVMLVNSARVATKARKSLLEDGIVEREPSTEGWKIAVFLVIGMVGLPLGAQFLVTGATGVAKDLGVSDAVIGLTLVAIGTSLPELATTITAAIRRQADIAIGNVIGSNLFNLAGIIGIASFFGPLDVAESLLRFDIWVMMASTLALIPFAFYCKNMTRATGAVFVSVYVIYMVSLF